MEMVALIVAGGLLVALPLLALRVLARLPDAPGCPCCHTVTRESDGTGRGALLLGQVAGTCRRTCTACGWCGYMRWRWAARRVDREGPE